MARTRIDALLVERGLFESRARASAAVMAGQVLIGIGREPASKPGQLVDDAAELALRGGKEYVSRGGHKLASVLDSLAIRVEGRRWLDVGISTGGFTDCLLQRGAGHVVGVDVAYGQVAWSVSQDPRVTVVERTNARELRPEQVGEPVDAIVADVSFISLTKVLPAVARVHRPRVRRAAHGQAAVRSRAGARRQAGRGPRSGCPQGRGALRRRRSGRARVGGHGCRASWPAGPKGNVETFVHFTEAGRPGAAPALTDDLEAGIA